MGLIGGFFGPILFLGGIAVIAAVIIWVWRRSCDGFGVHRSERASAIELLQRRYACGELTRDEFLRIQEDLT